MVAAFILVSPLSKLQYQADYKTIENLKSEVDSKNLTIYSLDRVSPEIIWQYGDKIVPLRTPKKALQLPNESQFGLLIQSLNKTDSSLLTKRHKLEFQQRFDLNKAAEDSRNHKSRLVTDYYLITKK